MEQYVSDNERLRKKVSELGERMEFYKDKLIKYRNLYFQTTGQDPQRPSSSSSNHSSQPMERHSSSSSNCRENVAGISAITLNKRKPFTFVYIYMTLSFISIYTTVISDDSSELSDNFRVGFIYSYVCAETLSIYGV